MKVFSIAKGAHRLTKRAPPELSQRDLDKLRALTIYKKTYDVPLVCKTFGISKATLYRWLGRFDPKDLSTLKDRSRRPKRLRKPEWPYELITAVRDLRNQYPRWGKDKLVVLLSEQGFKTSTSTVGRIIAYLSIRGDLVEPKRKAISAKRKVNTNYTRLYHRTSLSVLAGALTCSFTILSKLITYDHAGTDFPP